MAEGRAHRAGRLVLRLLSGLLTVAAVTVVLGLAVGRLALHLGVSPVLSGSMRPTYAPGDAVVTRLVDVRTVRPGMVVAFVPPGERVTYAHRVVSVSGDPAHPVVTTRGDANPGPDAWHARLSQPTVATVVAVVPKLGYAEVAVADRRVRAAFIGLLGLLATSLLTRRVLASCSSPGADLRPAASVSVDA